MKSRLKIYLVFTFLILSAGGAVCAEEAESQNGTGYLAGTRYHSADRAFVVETDEESAAESLNRVSGTIDLGFAAPEHTYQSKNHARMDPLKEKEPDNSY